MQRIDLDERRRKVAQIAVDVIAREGIDAATVRQIAAQAGSSTTFITKYFADKRELLLSAYRLVSANTFTEFEQKIPRTRADLITCLMSLTALDEKSRSGWRIHIAFWEKAGRDPVLASEQRYWIATARRSIEGAIRATYGDNSNIGTAAQMIIALLHGISIQVLFEPESWTEERVREVLAQQLESAIGHDRS
jgi:AcrR family transcriptional regulator